MIICDNIGDDGFFIREFNVIICKGIVYLKCK